uniref:Uncharacterized conserved protein n=1 Tax=uncultured delta proteobacterium HF0130_05G09 TaxID=710827 RepID=E0XXL2_9DELT|nr:uncharacterized conserved protein [uncultured delta proteobacterium HF0130_05G09]
MNKFKVGIGGIFTESNEFSKSFIDLQSFERGGIYTENQILSSNVSVVNGCLDELERNKLKVAPILYASSSPGGLVRIEAYKYLVKKFINILNKNDDIDALILNMHGAAILEDRKHLDNEFLEIIKNLRKDIPIILTVDLHAYIHKNLLKNCDAILAWETYPHNDSYTTGRRAIKLLNYLITNKEKLYMEFTGVPVITSAVNSSTEISSPFSKIMKSLKNKEKNDVDILSTSLFLCQPYIDQKDMRSGALVISNKSKKHAKTISSHFAKEYWKRRHEFIVETFEAKKALDIAICSNKKHTVLVEASDCCGGGAAGDSVNVIKLLIEKNLNKVSFSIIVDPKAVKNFKNVKIGSSLNIELGHGIDNRWGHPIKKDLVLLKKSDGNFVYKGGIWDKEVGRMGESVLVRYNNNFIVICTHSTYEWKNEQYELMGLNTNDCDILLVKNPMNFNQIYRKTSFDTIYIDSFGPTPVKIENLNFKYNIKYFPKFNNIKINLL